MGLYPKKLSRNSTLVGFLTFFDEDLEITDFDLYDAIGIAKELLKLKIKIKLKSPETAMFRDFCILKNIYNIDFLIDSPSDR